MMISEHNNQLSAGTSQSASECTAKPCNVMQCNAARARRGAARLGVGSAESESARLGVTVGLFQSKEECTAPDARGSPCAR